MTTISAENNSIFFRIRRRIYNFCTNDWQLLLCFAIPCMILFAAYVIFGVWPFGGESVLSLDLNGQYVYYYDHMYDVLYGGESVFYSWNRNLSGEFMGIIGYYLASPFNFIVWLFPRECITEGLFAMMCIKVGSIGLACGIYLDRCRKYDRVTVVIFSIMYALCAYTVVQTMNPMWLDGVLALPLIAFGLEKLIDEGKFKLLIISWLYSFVSCFYIGYMLAIFSVLYFIYYLINTDKIKKTYMLIINRFAMAGLAAASAVLMSCFMIMPVYQSLSLGKFDFSTPDYSLVTNFHLIDLLDKLLPNSYDTVRMIGLPFIYCGTLTVLLLPLFFFCKKIKLTTRISSGIFIIIMAIFMYIRPIDMMWHGGQLPNWLPYRYSFMLSFLFIIMAAETFSKLKSLSQRWIGIVIAFMLGILVYLENTDNFIEELGSEGRDVLDKLTVILPAVFVLVVISVFLIYYRKKLCSRSGAKVAAVLLCVVVSGEALYSTTGSIYKQDQDIVYSDRDTYADYIPVVRDVVDSVYESDNSFYRIEKTFHRTVNDDMALNMYGLSHSSSTLNAKPIELLSRLGFTSRSHYTRYSGATPITSSLFGVKYILNTTDGSANYRNIKTTDDIMVETNETALPIAYLANEQIQSFYPLLNDPFQNQNRMLSLMTGESEDFFKRIYDCDLTTENVTQGTTTDNHHSFKIINSGENAQIVYDFTMPATSNLYMYLPTSYEREVNLWIKVVTPENENQTNDYDSAGTYFEGDNLHIKDFGQFNAGDHISVILTLTKDDLYFREAQFAYINSELTTQALDKLVALNENTVCEKVNSTELRITTDCDTDNRLVVTVPAEPGWEMYVDGTLTEIETIMDGTLISTPVSAGKHTIELKYHNPSYPVALYATALGAFIFAVMIFIELMDKKKSLSASDESDNDDDTMGIDGATGDPLDDIIDYEDVEDNEKDIADIDKYEDSEQDNESDTEEQNEK